MSNIEYSAELATVLERFVPADETLRGNWEDVVERVGDRARRPPALLREQASRTQHGGRLRRPAVFVAAAMVVIAAAASAFAIVRAFEEPFYAVGRVTRTVEGVRFSFDVPRGRGCVGAQGGLNCRGGWENGALYRVPGGDLRSRDISISKDVVGSQGAEANILWAGLRDRTQVAPCGKLLGGVAGGSMTDAAATVARAPGTELIEGPRRVILGGRPAMHVVLTVRRDRGCDPGYFFTWRAPECWGACWLDTGVGDTIRVWIVRARGRLLFIEAETKPPDQLYVPSMSRAEAQKLEQEIAKIIGSIHFD